MRLLLAFTVCVVGLPAVAQQGGSVTIGDTTFSPPPGSTEGVSVRTEDGVPVSDTPGVIVTEASEDQVDPLADIGPDETAIGPQEGTLGPAISLDSIDATGVATDATVTSRDVNIGNIDGAGPADVDFGDIGDVMADSTTVSPSDDTSVSESSSGITITTPDVVADDGATVTGGSRSITIGDQPSGEMEQAVIQTMMGDAGADVDAMINAAQAPEVMAAPTPVMIPEDASGGDDTLDATVAFGEPAFGSTASDMAEFGDSPAAIPLPGTVWLLLAGLGGIAAVHRRGRAQS